MMMAGSSHTVRELFDKKASQWTRAYATGGALASRAKLFRDEVASLRPAPGRVLDFGCGTGHIAKALVDAGYEVNGLDMSPAMISEGQRLFGEVVRLSVLPPEWSALPYPEHAFDVAIASSVLEYVDDPGFVLRELARVLRPGGLLVVTVPNTRHPRRWLEQFFAGCLRLPLVSRVAARLPRVDLYAHFLRTSRTRLSDGAWTAKFEAAGFSVERAGLGASPMLRLFSLGRRLSA